MKEEVPAALVEAHVRRVEEAARVSGRQDPLYGLEGSGIAGTGLEDGDRPGRTHAHSCSRGKACGGKQKAARLCVFSQDENSDDCKADSQPTEEKREAKVPCSSEELEMYRAFLRVFCHSSVFTFTSRTAKMEPQRKRRSRQRTGRRRKKGEKNKRAREKETRRTQRWVQDGRQGRGMKPRWRTQLSFSPP